MPERKCGLYIRVSTIRQANVIEGSLDAQESRLREYVATENKYGEENWIITEVYREEGRSGKDMKRPEFQRLRNDIDANKINTVIVAKIDRLTRSLRDFSILWEKFNEEGVEFVSLGDNFDTKTAIGRAMLQIVLVFAQLEREQTGERTAATMTHRAEQGLWNGGRVVGYDLDADNKGSLLINDEQAELVKKAYQLCIQMGSAGKVQKELNEVGYRTPAYESRRGKRHGDNMFNKQTVIRILSNPVYLGKLTWGGKIFNGKHSPIIDNETFEKVQKILNNNRKTRTNAMTQNRHTYLLKGILRCGRCGAIMTPRSGSNGRGKIYHYYQCTTSAHIGKAACCSKYLSAGQIEEFIIQRVKDLTIDEKELQKIIIKANEEGNQLIHDLKKDKEVLHKQYQKTTIKLNKIIDSIENGELQTFKSINKRMESLEKANLDFEEKINTVDFKINQTEQETVSSELMHQTFKAFRDIVEKAKPRKLKDLLFRIIDVIEWHENEEDRAAGHCKISYFEQPHLKLPQSQKEKSEQCFETLFAESTSWLPSTDLNRGPIG